MSKNSYNQDPKVIELETDGIKITIDCSGVNLTEQQMRAMRTLASVTRDSVHTVKKGSNGHHIRNTDLEHQHDGPTSPHL